MIQTSRKAKIGLVFLGIFLGILVVEMSLRIAGAVLISRQEALNVLSARDTDVTILCIGESTTLLGGETSYPSLLEESLHRRIPDKSIRVINKGLAGRNSQKIWRKIPGYLDQYDPDIVVIMLGINDHTYTGDPDSFLFKVHNVLYNLRFYKIFCFIVEEFRIRFSRATSTGDASSDMPEETAQITTNEDLRKSYEKIAMITKKLSQVREDLAASQDPSKNQRLRDEESTLIDFHARILTQVGEYYLSKFDFAKAYQYLLSAYELAPKNYFVVYTFAQLLYRDKKYPQAVEFFKKAIHIRPDQIRPYFKLAKVYDVLGMHDEVYAIYQRVASAKAERLKHWNYYSAEAGQWFVENNYLKEAEEIYRKAIENSRTQFHKFHLYNQLAEVYEKQGKPELAKVQRYKATQASQERRTDTEFTKFYYNQIIELLLSRGVKVVCMQYALRDVRRLKETVSSQYSDQVLFIENKTNFENALEEYSYSDLFFDRFAGDFGHCTPLGHRILAENAAERIVEHFALDR